MTIHEAKQKYGKTGQDKNIFINWDAIESLPEQYEPVFSELIFDPKKLEEFFTNVGTDNKPSWYPRTETAYKIADMTGISGCDEKIIESIYEDIDINPLLLKPLDAEPTIRKKKIGVRVTKKSMIFCEDGSWRYSSPCSNEFNFWNRACMDFANEEEYTDSYKHQDKYKNKFKYDSPAKRQKRLLELEKFALQQAETKAFIKTVRELAGLPTGFTSDDLKTGKLVFVKFVKSKAYLKMEMAAKLQAISQGNTEQIQQLGAAVFGEQKQISEPDDIIPEPEPEQAKTTEEIIKELKDKLLIYIDIKLNNRKIIEKKKGALEYIQSMINNEKSTIEDLEKTIAHIEKISGIKKVDMNNLTDEEKEAIKPDEEDFFSADIV